MTINTMLDLEQLRSVNPDEVNRSELVDIQDIMVESHLPCKCGNMVVQSVFEETDIALVDRLIQYFRMT